MPKTVLRDDMREMLANGAQLVEVLPPEEYAEAHIAGAVNVPLKELDRGTTAGLRNDAPVIVYCHDYL